MKESYNIKPTVLSDSEIEEYLGTFITRLHGLTEMRQHLAQTSQRLIQDIKIHEENYRKVNSMYENMFEDTQNQQNDTK